LPDEWITVAQAAVLMKLGKRGALQRLGRLNAQWGGHLLKKIGDKQMPGRVQASKYLVSVEVLRRSMLPTSEATEREIDALKVALATTDEKLEALRKAVRPLLRAKVAANRSEREQTRTESTPTYVGQHQSKGRRGPNR
jgi:hypothetical protein